MSSRSPRHDGPGSGLFLQCFVNLARPTLNYPSVMDVPTVILGSTFSTQIEASLEVDPRNATECASSARLWESLLEKHRIPYLLLRVADMRYVLKSKVTAILLYEELQSQLNDLNFGQWIQETKTSLMSKLQRQLRAYKTSSLTHNPAQAWRSIKNKQPAFPSCAITPHNFQILLDTWNNLRTRGPNAILAKYLNLTALETNFLEGMFQFPPEIASTLVQVGFLHQIPVIKEDGITGGAVRSDIVALSILQNTRKALNWIVDTETPKTTLTLETLCHLHKTLMHTNQILNIHSRSTSPSPSTSPHSQSDSETSNTRLTYINIGVTRRTTCVNLTGYKLGVKFQFCPYDKVDDELKFFCERFNELIRNKDIDPFAAAAWISYTFLMIHPFEDGNSRISRLLASIPLIAKGLPPLCVPYSLKNTYVSVLNSMRGSQHRSDSSGEFHCQDLMNHFYECMKDSFELLKIV